MSESGNLFGREREGQQLNRGSPGTGSDVGREPAPLPSRHSQVLIGTRASWGSDAVPAAAPTLRVLGPAGHHENVSESNRSGKYEKLECLRSHYSSALVTLDSLPYGIKKGTTWDRLNDDQRGQFCMASVETACRKLSVEEFVLEGLPVPVIDKIEYYEEHFLLLEGERLRTLKVACAGKQGLISRLSARLDEELVAETRAREALRFLEENEGKKKEIEQAEQVLREAKGAVLHCDGALDKARSEEIECGEKIAKLEETARAKARRRYDEDQEASVRLRRSLNMLGSYIEKIFIDFRPFEEKCRDLGSRHYDPFKAEDYHGVYLNLVRAYKCEDQLSVVGYIVSVMRKPMQDGNLAKFRTSMEDFLAQLRDLKVDRVSPSDLAALVFLLNVKDEHRREFFKSENVLKLTAAGLNQSDDEDEECADGGSVSVRSRRVKQDLFGRVREYCKQQEAQDKLNKSFARGGDNEAAVQKRQQQQADAEAREVMAIGKFKKGVCYAFQSGECTRGDSCRFSHEKDSQKDSPALRGPCWNFAKGECPYGKSCRYEHVKSESTANVTGGSSVSPTGAAADSSAKAIVNAVKKGRSKAVSYGDKDRDEISSSEDGSVRSYAMRVSRVAKVCSAVKVEGKKMSLKIHWDTASTDHCTNDPRILSDGYDALKGLSAKGVGGNEKITAVGDSGVFKLEGMLLLPKAKIPNILSVGKDTKLQKKIRPMVYILDHEGGTRLRADKEDLKLLKRLVERARADGRIVGEAAVEGGVYVEDFGKQKGGGAAVEQQRKVSSYSITAEDARSRRLVAESVQDSERGFVARKGKVPRKCGCSTDAAAGRGDVAGVVDITAAASVGGGDGAAPAVSTLSSRAIAGTVRDGGAVKDCGSVTAEATWTLPARVAGEVVTAGAVHVPLMAEKKFGVSEMSRLSAILDDALAGMSVEETDVCDDAVNNVESMIAQCALSGAHCQSLGAAIVNDRGV